METSERRRGKNARHINIPGYPSPQIGDLECQLPDPPVYCPKCKAEVSDYQRPDSTNGLVWCPWCSKKVEL